MGLSGPPRLVDLKFLMSPVPLTPATAAYGLPGTSRLAGRRKGAGQRVGYVHGVAQCTLGC